MIAIHVCIGSACHLKGSYDVIGKLQDIVEEEDLGDQVEIKAAFCLGNCQNAVSVKIDQEETVYSVSKKTVREFFDSNVRPRLAE